MSKGCFVFCGKLSLGFSEANSAPLTMVYLCCVNLDSIRKQNASAELMHFSSCLPLRRTTEHLSK